jgi:hypothetical protein
MIKRTSILKFAIRKKFTFNFIFCIFNRAVLFNTICIWSRILDSLITLRNSRGSSSILLGLIWILLIIWLLLILLIIYLLSLLILLLLITIWLLLVRIIYLRINLILSVRVTIVFLSILVLCRFLYLRFIRRWINIIFL